MVEQIKLLLGSGIGWPALFGSLGALFYVWVKTVNSQKIRNTVNEIDLTNQKIDFKNHSDPIDDLVSASNKSHAAGPVVKDPGDSGQGGK